MTLHELSLPVPMTFYFGRRPYFVHDPARRVPTPTGENCLHCGEPIEATDAGVLTAVGVLEPENSTREDGFVGKTMPGHEECHVRSAIGGIGHVLKKCRCFGGTLDNDLGLSYRESASLVWAWVQLQGSADPG